MNQFLLLRFFDAFICSKSLMKKHFTSLLLSLCIFQSYAQITLTAGVQPKVHTYNAIFQETENLQDYKLTADASNGYSWDLSNFSKNNSFTFEYIEPAKTQFPNEFSKSSVAVGGTGSSTHQYFLNSDTAFLRTGHVTSIFSDTNVNYYAVPYDKPLAQYKYPMTYNDSFKSTTTYSYKRVIFAEETVYGIINRSVTADGYGKVKLPSGKELDVLRLLVRSESGDSTRGNTRRVSISYTYEFWSKDYTMPIVTAYRDHDTINYIQWLDLENSKFLSDNRPQIIPETEVFPNPSAGQIQIQLPKSASLITVRDMLGRTVFETTATPTLHLNNLHKGTYVLDIRDSNGNIVARNKLSLIL